MENKNEEQHQRGDGRVDTYFPHGTPLTSTQLHNDREGPRHQTRALSSPSTAHRGVFLGGILHRRMEPGNPLIKAIRGLYTLLAMSATRNRNRGCSKQLVVFRVVRVSPAELIYCHRLCLGRSYYSRLHFTQ